LFFFIAIYIVGAMNAEDFCIVPVIHLDKSLLLLNLRGKMVREICSEAFVDFDALQKLDLSWNQLTVLSKDLFKPLHNIVTIDLSENKLTAISFDEFSNNERLIALNLRFNNIQTIETIQHSVNPTHSAIVSSRQQLEGCFRIV
jgi:Leucine rich repeat